MNALISPNEPVYSWDEQLLGVRVAQVEANPFPVASPLFWVPCADYVVANEYYYDTDTQTINPIPLPPDVENATVLTL